MHAHGGAPITVYRNFSDTYFALAISGSTVGSRMSGLVSTKNAKFISNTRNIEP